MFDLLVSIGSYNIANHFVLKYRAVTEGRGWTGKDAILLTHTQCKAMVASPDSVHRSCWRAFLLLCQDFLELLLASAHSSLQTWELAGSPCPIPKLFLCSDRKLSLRYHCDQESHAFWVTEPEERPRAAPLVWVTASEFVWPSPESTKKSLALVSFLFQ